MKNFVCLTQVYEVIGLGDRERPIEIRIDSITAYAEGEASTLVWVGATLFYVAETIEEVRALLQAD